MRLWTLQEFVLQHVVQKSEVQVRAAVSTSGKGMSIYILRPRYPSI